MSRSEAVRQALREWTRIAMEQDEERITRQERNQRRLMGWLDFIVGMIREQDAVLEHIAVGDPADGSEAPPGTPAGGQSRSGALAEARKRARSRVQ